MSTQPALNLPLPRLPNPLDLFRGGGGQPVGKDLGRFRTTAYGPPWNAMNGTGVTAGGTNLRDGKQAYIVAADPKVLPLGTRIMADPNPFGDPNIVFKVDDTGGAIKGKRLDFYDWRGRNAQMKWGRRSVKVTQIGSGGGGGGGIPVLPDELDPFEGDVLPDPLAGLKDLTAPLWELVTTMAAFTKGWLELLAKFFSVDTWWSIGKLILGMWFVIIGIRRLLEVQVT